MSNKLPAGMYLVGRRDGTVEPFFARITEFRHLITHDIPPQHLDDAINSPGRLWWWRPMKADKLPTDELLAQMPPHHFEDRKG